MTENGVKFQSWNLVDDTLVSLSISEVKRFTGIINIRVIETTNANDQVRDLFAMIRNANQYFPMRL
jgi:hypothetical protein